MSSKSIQHRSCTVCGKSFSGREIIPAAAVRYSVANEILTQCPQWSADSFICRADLNRFRSRYVHSLVESEKGDVTSLEEEVIRSLRDHDILARNLESGVDEDRSLGDRWADHLASFGGSWTFLICFAAFMALWITMNSLLLWWRPVDPYPFILLNLVLSCLAAIQAPIIMMSQNRQEAKDRLRAQHDYQVNLKAELEIRHLNEKMDHVLVQQWERLVQIQEIQLELLAEIGKKA